MKTAPQPVIYFDNNATTPVDPAVFEAMTPWLRDEFGNPSSVYALGRRASAALDTAREQVAELIAAAPSEIIFTSCGSESINSAILSAISLDPDKTHIITSAVEHSATIKLCEHLARRGYEITWLPVDASGHLDPENLAQALCPDTALVSLLWANNETGVLFPIEEISALTNAKKVPLHVDAVQAVGKLPLNVNELGAQFLSLSGHKLHCPKGVGALHVNKRMRYTPWLRGSQENSRRGGTQNVASIVGLGKAASLAAAHLAEDSDSLAVLRDQFEKNLIAALPDTRINGDRAQRLPNTSNLAFPDVDGEAVLMLLDAENICCSAGSACTSDSVNPSHVLKAMGYDNARIRSSLRFSFGRFNTAAEIETACQIIPRVVTKLRKLHPSSGPVSMAD